MRTSPEPGRPRVYVCGAEVNKPTAERVLEVLSRHQIGTFYPHTDLLPGDQILERVEKHLGSSDYFLLIWSKACADHPAVREEWAAYVLTKVREKQGFLFVVRLDNSRLPALLGIRRQINAFEGFHTAVDAAVEEVLAYRAHDRALGLPVLPAPEPVDHADQPTVVLYVRNVSFNVCHVMAVPENCTGASLLEEIRRQLILRDDVTDRFGRRAEFEYRLFLDERPIPPDSHAEAGLTDEAVIALQVNIYSSVKDDEHLIGEYRPIPGDAMPPAARDRLLRKAFGHLFPHDR